MKRQLPPYIYRRERDGILFFKKRVGTKFRTVILETQFPEGAPIPFALHQERERLLGERTPVKPGRDMAAVVRHYMAHAKFQEKKPRTRQDYEKHLAYISDKLGQLSPKNIERRHVISWLEAWAKKETPHKANYRFRVLRIVLEHAIDMGLLPTGGNPARDVAELKYEKRDRQPWPADRVKAFREDFPHDLRVRLLFELLVGTGQRIGDVLKMQWGDIKDGGIEVKQGKTGKKLWLPLTKDLRAALAQAERKNLTILTNERGIGAWSYRGAHDAMMKARVQIGAVDHDIHALRYYTAVELCEAGCDDELISSVTGQSPEMVRHYTRAVRQKVRAIRAQKARE
ncbi:site-specific integrase [Mesobacterium pallidum]|uniref:site-specific integrase n=1 Tax=Mesobacterium pallidum TaxID=2872037 RepID=UPI001EE1A801|nr:tyrosine-type recombinase/integrase [Mesobacterium pallidum]